MQEGNKTTDVQLKKFEDSRKVKTGLVVLMHDRDKHATPETAREIIKGLKLKDMYLRISTKFFNKYI